MLYRNVFFLLLCTVICIFFVTSVQAQGLDLCQRFGVLNGKYLDQTPPRLVIYDANFGLSPSVDIYKPGNNLQSGEFTRAGADSLEIGMTLSYTVDYIGIKKHPLIKKIWIIPHRHCHTPQ